MNACQRYHDLIAAYAGGEIGPSDLEDLLSHSSECEDCRGMVELHKSFATMANNLPEPSEQIFESMRARVLDQLEMDQTRAAGGSRASQGFVHAGRLFWNALADWFGSHPVPVTAVLLVLLFAAGLAGRWTAASTWSDKSLLRAVQEQADHSTGLDGFWDATFTFANVSVRQTEAGDLSLGFDVCRHVEAETPRSSPLVREVLLSTIIESPTLGVRLKAMDMAPELDDVRLQEALIYTLHNDPNLAVRLQALDVLTRRPLDATAQDALLRTLRGDTSVQVRLNALEALAAQEVDPEAIRKAVSEAGQASDVVIMQRVLQLMGQS